MSEDHCVAFAFDRPQHSAPIALGVLAAELGARVVGSADGVEVTGFTLSTQRVRPGDLYAALPGSRSHGIAFAAAAAESGAVAVLTDPDGAAGAGGIALPLLVVDAPRTVLGPTAARIYGDPARSMQMIGVTGTQGKTTTTLLAEGGMRVAGIAAGVIGTVGTRVDGQEVRTSLTTPEAPDLHGLFAVMRERGVEVCAMEVSSHALVLGRVDGVVFDVAVFLNLGRDHLDFHADVEDYFSAKASLFTPERARVALLNIDDEHGRRLAGETTLPVRTMSAAGLDADWTVRDVDSTAAGSTFVVRAPDGGTFPGGCSLPGDFNISNSLAAIAACGEAGLDPEAVAAGIMTAGGVPGRFERVEQGQDFEVIVDYAHKPDAVEAAIRTLRPLTEGRVIVVIGAGGDRDPGKRPMMGEIAARLSDLLVITDDNPRTEDPATIRAAMRAGADGGSAEVIEIGDRRTAIFEAIGRARVGDVVLVAGKGHETGQEIQGVVHPFDDRVVAREALQELAR